MVFSEHFGVNTKFGVFFGVVKIFLVLKIFFGVKKFGVDFWCFFMNFGVIFGVKILVVFWCFSILKAHANSR